MVAQFLGLKLRLLANTFRRSPWQIVGIVIAVIYGFGASAVAILGLAGLRLADPETARSVVVVFGSIVVLGFLLVPLAFGVDDTLDPRRFSLFGLPTTRLAALLVLTALVSVPSLVITVVALTQVVTWSRGALPTFLALVGAVVIVATCVLAARVTTSLAAFLLATRRAREISGLVALIALVCLSPAVAILATIDWADEGLAVLGRIADVASWTPLGAVWAAPADAANGDARDGILKLFIAVAFVAVLWLAWRGLVAAMLVSPEREGASRNYRGLGWFDRLPTSPLGVVAARSLTYWMRDPRYRSQLVIVPLLPITLVIVFLVVDVYWRNLALLPLPIMCLFLSWLVHNDVAFDNTAIWLHVASNTSGVADRIGRIVPVLLLGVPLILVGVPISAALYGDPSVMLSLFGVCTCILFAGLGFASLISARFPYPVVRPGDSPFSQPQASGGAASFLQGLAFFATTAITAPSLALGLYGLADHGSLPLLSFVVGLGVGVIVLAIGIWGGARIFERRGPELLAFTLRN